MRSRATSPEARWGELHGKRHGLIRRAERYAEWTLPHICPPDNYDEANEQLALDYQSLGAEGVNHLTNKLMLALFAPSRPFFRIDLPREAAEQAGDNKKDLDNELSIAEQAAAAELDKRPIRPRLYDALKHLLVTGNVLKIYEGDEFRILGLKHYCVKRDVNGKVLELVIKERVHCTELDKAIISEIGNRSMGEDADGYVCHYRWVEWDGARYCETQSIGTHVLGEKFSGKYTPEKMPYHALSWELPSGADYGIGLVENYARAFAGLSTMSAATVQAALLASEFRWLVNPTGITKPEDLANSQNGDALPGVQGDVTLVQSQKGGDLQINLRITEQYINQIGRAFMLQSAVTRDAERVTAEEIRAVANELETSLGGAYSRIAIDLQLPMAHFLLRLADKDIKGSSATVSIVTGLAALSRTGDRDQLMLFLGDVTQVSTLPPNILDRLKLGPIMAALASARGLSTSEYMLTEQEYSEKVAEQQRAAMLEELANRMPIASPEGVNASQALVAGEAMSAAVDARSRSQ